MARAKFTNTTEQKIQARAHEIWLREGRPHGRDRDHWHQAEAELAAEKSSDKPRARSAAPPSRSRRKATAAE